MWTNLLILELFIYKLVHSSEPYRENVPKRTLLIDFDGVLNKYKWNFDKSYIPEPKEGTKEFLEKLSQNFELRLFTTRNKILASKWLVAHKLDKYFEDITNVKELNWLMIDDRCLKFDGDYEKLIYEIEGFKPWYKYDS